MHIFKTKTINLYPHIMSIDMVYVSQGSILIMLSESGYYSLGTIVAASYVHPSLFYLH